MQYQLEQFSGPLEILLKLLRHGELSSTELELLLLCRQLRSALETTPLPLTAGAEDTLAFAQIAEHKLSQLNPAPLEDAQEGGFNWLDGIEEYVQMKLLAQLLWQHQESSMRRYGRRPRAALIRARILTWEELRVQLKRVVERQAKISPQAGSPPMKPAPPSRRRSRRSCSCSSNKVLSSSKLSSAINRSSAASATF